MARRARRKPKGDPTLVVAYVRVSTDEQQLGPRAQRAAFERWCEERGTTLVHVGEDLGVSGGADIDRRPGLLAALDALAEHGAGILLVAKRDRLARDVMNAAIIDRMVERVGAQVVSVAGEGTEAGADDPSAFLLRGMVDLLAHYERLLIAQRTRAALAVKRARGERVGHLPFGFGLAEDGVHLVPHPDEQRVLNRVLRYRRSGLSLREIGRRLSRAGIRPRSGGRWHPQTVARVVTAAEGLRSKEL